MEQKMKSLAGIVFISILLTGCENKEKIEKLEQENSSMREEIADLRKQNRQILFAGQNLKFLASKMKGIKATIHTNYGSISLDLFPEKAPVHCFAFITRAESGFYDKTQFHRIMSGFMIQGGDPLSKNDNPDDDGLGGPIVSIPHEFNPIPHKRGILSMARVGNVNMGAGSQFFIMHGENRSLDNQYTVFGSVSKGMDTVDKIAGVKVNQKDHPVKPVIIKTIEVKR